MFTRLTRWIKAHDLLTYFVLAFLFTYAAWSVTLLSPVENDPDRMTDLPSLFQFLGMWGPGLAGILVTALTRGRAGLKELFRRVLLWRAPLRWYLFILLLWPIVLILRDFLIAGITGQTVSFQWSGWSQTMNWGLAQPLILGFWACEEIGWRGFALPRLQSRWNALTSSLILGTVWALWHLPLFFMGLPPLAYWIFTVSVTVLMVWIMNNNQGSVFLAIFFHYWINAYGNGIHADRFVVGGANPVQQTFIQALLLAAVAAGVVALYGYRTLTRGRESPLLAGWKPSAS